MTAVFAVQIHTSDANLVYFQTTLQHFTFLKETIKVYLICKTLIKEICKFSQ